MLNPNISAIPGGVDPNPVPPRPVEPPQCNRQGDAPPSLHPGPGALPQGHVLAVQLHRHLDK